MNIINYRVRTLQPPSGQEYTGRYLSGYYVHDSGMRRTNLYTGVALSGDSQPSQRSRTILDKVLAATSESLQLNNTYIQDSISLRDLSNPPEQGIAMLSQ
jgi:hypothetical protein